MPMNKLLLFFTCVALACTAARADTITIRADQWCPYNCKPGSDHPGILIEVATEIFARAGHQVEYANMPWTRAISETRSGRFNAIVGAFREDAPDFVFPGHSAITGENRFYVIRKKDWTYAGIGSLQGVRLGGILGYSYGEALDAYIREDRARQRVYLAKGDRPLEALLKLLQAGRLDAVIEDRWVVEYFLRDHPGLAADLHPAGSLGGEPIYIAFSPQRAESADYARILGDGIARIKRTGHLNRIIARYSRNAPAAKPTH